MPSVTAGAVTSVWIDPPAVIRELASSSPETFYISVPGGAQYFIKQEARLKEFLPIPASWVEKVNSMISDSIELPGTAPDEAGTSLRFEIADAAQRVFKTTSDLLPGEPFIYASRNGELIAEFETQHGRLTTVISHESILAFAIVNDIPVERHIMLEPSKPYLLRNGLKEITDSLRTGHLHGHEVGPAE